MISAVWKWKDWIRVWLYGFFSFYIQLALGILVIMDQTASEFGGTTLGMPSALENMASCTEFPLCPMSFFALIQ